MAGYNSCMFAYGQVRHSLHLLLLFVCLLLLICILEYLFLHKYVVLLDR